MELANTLLWGLAEDAKMRIEARTANTTYLLDGLNNEVVRISKDGRERRISARRVECLVCARGAERLVMSCSGDVYGVGDAAPLVGHALMVTGTDGSVLITSSVLSATVMDDVDESVFEIDELRKAA